MNPTPAPIRGEKTPKIPKPGSVCGDLWEKPPHAPNTGIHPWGKAGREPNAAICPQLLGENPPRAPRWGQTVGSARKNHPVRPTPGPPRSDPRGKTAPPSSDSELTRSAHPQPLHGARIHALPAGARPSRRARRAVSPREMLALANRSPSDDAAAPQSGAGRPHVPAVPRLGAERQLALPIRWIRRAGQRRRQPEPLGGFVRKAATCEEEAALSPAAGTGQSRADVPKATGTR